MNAARIALSRQDLIAEIRRVAEDERRTPADALYRIAKLGMVLFIGPETF